MKPGDLICYNAAGMKRKTLGLVIELKDGSPSAFQDRWPTVLIQWCCVGELMPSPEWSGTTHPGDVYPGSMVWYRQGNWFEVVK